LPPGHRFPMAKFRRLHEHLLAHGIACNTAGGSHHAFADHGSGYCVFNDVAVAARALLAEGVVRRVLVIDLDALVARHALLFQEAARLFA